MDLIERLAIDCARPDRARYRLITPLFHLQLTMAVRACRERAANVRYARNGLMRMNRSRGPIGLGAG